MKICLVHDYLYDYGGAERVLEAMHEIWPEAPIYTAWVDWVWFKRNKPEWSASWRIRPSWFQALPFKRKLTSPLRFLAKAVWESFDVSEYDVVVSSVAWFVTKGIKTTKSQLHVCYIHTPPRYLYGLPTAADWQKNWLIRAYAALINPWMRKYDFEAAQKPDLLVTNSENTRRRIKKFYRRDARVIYPPINLASSGQRLGSSMGNYFLMVNRLVAPKRIDVGIKAALKSGVGLKIVGRGREEARLKQLARGASNIEFLGYVDDKELNRLYAGCRAVLYLAEEEDFGITPVEAMSFGKPVIAANSGGVKETVVQGKTGILLDDWGVEKLAKVLSEFKSGKFKASEIITHSRKFSKERFKRELGELVEKEYAKLRAK